jgi:sterol desaturase/sphingolipid hydroxylase (fatty acid hydroxylase superfamily)
VEASSKQTSFKFGDGKISGSISVFLGLLSLFGVLCFHFPEHLTTPELRKVYSVEMIRWLMRGAMFLSIFLGSLTFFMSKGRRLGFAGILVTVLAQLLGGATVEVGEFESSKISFGLDWLVLDLLSSTAIFIFLEKLFPQKKDQATLRPEWKEDLAFFAFNHLLIGYTLLVTIKFSSTLFGWAISPTVQNFIREQPFVLQFAAALFLADFMQYWSHRAYHEVPFLWKIHSIHHSPAAMDWLSGSRLHLIELLATRAMVFLPIFLCGFDESVLNAYVVFVGFQAVLNHANVDLNIGALRYVLVTPHFHHWHHAADEEAIDKNYAAHLPVLDLMFGSHIDNYGRWPKKYGVVGKVLPRGLIRQHIYPFRDTSKYTVDENERTKAS